MTLLPARKNAFVLAATHQGTFIVNRFDHATAADGATIGIGHHLLEAAACDPEEVGIELSLLDLARSHRGDGVVAVDCGANLGVHTVEYARHMTGWGTVNAFEAQERLFYALCGNLALNNCFNATARHAAVSDRCGTLRIPVPDYLRPASFGSLELRPSPANENIGQEVDYSDAASAAVAMVSLDALPFPRLDLLKIDVEGMEGEVLHGAQHTLARCRPYLIVEALKGDHAQLQPWLEAHGYCVWRMATGPNLVAVHRSDPAARQIRPAA